ncbi:phage major tail tube protein [Asticcacaulis taihuensis]|uniref:phage major tail tube protein n=1 Tax=Asticcacaulis taihuensis TaxID=260084 RepID=UPI0026F221A4|nr:phage major tail tube protein [Asticcacaulis taihuensis]
MALPEILKNMNTYGDGESWLGKIGEITLPKIGRKFDDYQGAGMDAPVPIDMGGQALECEFKTGGRLPALALKVGMQKADGTLLRFLGSFQSDDTGQVHKVEVVVRGRIEELDRGTWKVGEKGEETVKMKLTYYKEIEDGRTLIEIDNLNFKYVVNGVDILADHRNALEI